MKITKEQLKQIIKEEILQLEMFDTGSAGEEAGGASLVQKKAECEKAGGKWVSEDPTGKYGHCSKSAMEEEIVTEGRYEEIDRDEFKSTLQGSMEPLSQQDLEAILPDEKIADPMNPATFEGALIPLGQKDQFVYFKDFYGPVLRAPIGGEETEVETQV